MGLQSGRKVRQGGQCTSPKSPTSHNTQTAQVRDLVNDLFHSRESDPPSLPLKAPCTQRNHQRIAMPTLGQGLDRGGLVNHPRVVEQKQ
jgi:hypothetical protein